MQVSNVDMLEEETANKLLAFPSSMAGALWSHCY